MREAHRGDVLTADTTIRQGLRPGDVGAVTRLHGVLYEREHGLDHHIEASVAEGMARYADAWRGRRARRCGWPSAKARSWAPSA